MNNILIPEATMLTNMARYKNYVRFEIEFNGKYIGCYYKNPAQRASVGDTVVIGGNIRKTTGIVGEPYLNVDYMEVI